MNEKTGLDALQQSLVKNDPANAVRDSVLIGFQLPEMSPITQPASMPRKALADVKLPSQFGSSTLQRSVPVPAHLLQHTLGVPQYFATPRLLGVIPIAGLQQELDSVLSAIVPGGIHLALRLLKLRKLKVKGLNYEIQVDDAGVIKQGAGTVNVEVWGGSVEFKWFLPGKRDCTYSFINTVARSVEWMTFDSTGDPSLAGPARDALDTMNPVQYNVSYRVDGPKGQADPTSRLTSSGETKSGMPYLLKHDDPALSPGLFAAAGQQGANADPGAKSVKVTATWVIQAWFIEECGNVSTALGFHEVTVICEKTFAVADGRVAEDDSGAPVTRIEDTDSGPGTPQQKAALNGALAGFGKRVR